MTQVRVRNSINTSDSSDQTALELNEKRVRWRLQNVGTDPLFYKKGPNCTTGDYTGILAPETLAKNGEGATAMEEGDYVYLGEISVAGVTLNYTVSEDIRAT